MLHEPLRPASGLQIQDAGATHLLAGVGNVAMTEQLQAGAHGEDDYALIDGNSERRRLEGEVLRRDRHLHVLPAVEQDDIELAKVRRLALLDRHDVDGDAPPLRATLSSEGEGGASRGGVGAREGLDPPKGMPGPAAAYCIVSRGAL